jgi:hypothetical protein
VSGTQWQETAAAQTAPGSSPCDLQLSKWADPTTLELGDDTTLTLVVGSDCPSRPVPLHVALTIDASSSMTRDGKIDAAMAAAKAFIDPIDLSVSQVGVVSFNSKVTVETELTSDRATAIAAIDGIATNRGTDISLGIDESRGVLARGHGTASPQPIDVMVVMSDGQQHSGQTGGDAAVLAAADRAKADGILVATVCFGTDCQADVMRQAASRDDLYFDAQSADLLIDVYKELAGQLASTSLRTLTVVDTLPSNMTYVSGSAAPAPADSGSDWLKWTWSVVPSTGVTVTFRVEPQEPGRWPTNTEAVADFVDTEDLSGSGIFPVPEVVVVPQTPTPRPTWTAVPTRTPKPLPSATPSYPHCVCKVVQDRVPPVVIADALANPDRYYGWRYPLDQGKPASPANPPRECLTLMNVSMPYHFMWNKPIWRVGCP